jgi:hypothetical protein
MALIALSGCSSKVTKPAATSTPIPTSRAYNGTASVGDFMTIAIDANAQTIHYDNHSNGDSATVPYTVNPDGTYTLSDPTGNLVAAYEVPNFVMMIQAAKTGPNHNEASLITAVQSSPISMATIENHQYNYMQFRTAAGGIELGSVNISGTGDVNVSSYWPFGAMNGQTAFHNNQVNQTPFVPDSGGTFMRLSDGGGGYDYVFGTPNGVFAVDTQNGAILSFIKAASKDFVAANAGTYKAIFYQKTGAHTGMGNVETGTASQGSGTIVITSTGDVTITDAASTVLAAGTLVPVADDTTLVGTGKISDPCNGLFTLRTTTGTSQQDVFCTFLNGAVLFSSYKAVLPLNGGNPYDYFYGCALK